MNFIVSNKSPLSLRGYNNTLFLIKDNWDDWFRYETKYFLCYVNNGQRVDIGSVKIGQLDMEQNQRTANIPTSFTHLSNEFFSLGQSD